jgi:regulator of cell morphogenesis and NO signaling
MTQPDVHSTLREWLAFRPGLARVFTKHGIDLCLDTGISLNELCSQKRIDPLILMADIERMTRSALHEMGDWATAPLADLCQHIESHHHAFYRRELPRLTELMAKVERAYASTRPEMRELEVAFQEFRARLESHIDREERELFPAVRQLMELRPPARPPGIGGLINSLETDHDAVDAGMLQIRKLTRGFVAPPDVCQTFQSLLDGLWELEMNLHQNVYEENRFLFPRAARHESALAAAGHAATSNG